MTPGPTFTHQEPPMITAFVETPHYDALMGAYKAEHGGLPPGVLSKDEERSLIESVQPPARKPRARKATARTRKR